MVDEWDLPERLGPIGSQQVDPIGISMLISILATALKTLGGIVEYGPATRDAQEARRKFQLIRNEILSLQNSLDDFVLLVERYVHESDNTSFGDTKLTIADTMMVLRDRNYQRWRSIQDAIESVDRRIYDLLKDVRSLNIDYVNENNPDEPFDIELTHQFDSIILEMGEMTFAMLIKKMRGLLDSLATTLARLARMERG